MRSAFVKTLVEIAGQDSRIFLMTGDLGYMALEPFAEKFPERFINVGVAEQNLMGMATGLAEAGFIPFVYSITPFVVLRPYEFIRNGPIVHQLPVRIVGMGGGMEYATNGISHSGLEDIGVLRVQPGITLIAPADHRQTTTAILATWNLPGPVYYRLGKDDSITVDGLDGRFDFQRIQIVWQGRAVLILTMGAITSRVVVAAKQLEAQGISVRIGVVSTIQPVPKDLISLLSEFRVVMTVESHFVNGGLGSLVAETIAEQALKCRLIRCGVDSLPKGVSGNQAFMEDRCGLSAEKIALTARRAFDAMA
jgi:transketolase